MAAGRARRTLLIGTRNAGKLAELRELLRGAGWELASLADAGVDVDVDETGDTLEANAILKATEYARLAGMAALADDSGLEVDALGGAPGVHSARYAGAGATDGDRVALLLANLSGKARPWTARFRCVIAIAGPDGGGLGGGAVELHSGVCKGVIADAPRGDNGFGYDPVFFIPEMGRTMAELSDGEKNAVSHRAAAARRAAAFLARRAAAD